MYIGYLDGFVSHHHDFLFAHSHSCLCSFTSRLFVIFYCLQIATTAVIVAAQSSHSHRHRLCIIVSVCVYISIFASVASTKT